MPVPTPDAAALRALTTILKLACSGELAAAHAYRGHWKSVSAADEIARIQQIEAEELHHRHLLLEMLQALGEKPSRWAEARAWMIGRVLGSLCHVSGWLMPMYGAGHLESRNIREYESAARSAWMSGHREYVDCLLTMAEVEWDHESYFRERVRSHRLGGRLPIWSQPPPRDEIRESFRNALRPYSTNGVQHDFEGGAIAARVNGNSDAPGTAPAQLHSHPADARARHL